MHNLLFVFWLFRLLAQETSGQAQLYDKLKDLVQELIKSALVSNPAAIGVQCLASFFFAYLEV